MEVITRHSFDRAASYATRLWSLSSTQFPQRNAVILNCATEEMIENISSFALNARRVLEAMPHTSKYRLEASRWQTHPTAGHPVVQDFRDALNRIVHAVLLQVGFEQLPKEVSIIDGGAVVIPYVFATTDRKEKSYIDPFSLAHAFFYQLYPEFTEH
jgi:hypothetical protein